MEIPYDKLSAEILEAIIKDFVLQEGTDYGLSDYSLEEKIQQVKAQIVKGKATVVFDPETETCHIVAT